MRSPSVLLPLAGLLLTFLFVDAEPLRVRKAARELFGKRSLPNGLHITPAIYDFVAKRAGEQGFKLFQGGKRGRELFGKRSAPLTDDDYETFTEEKRRGELLGKRSVATSEEFDYPTTEEEQKELLESLLTVLQRERRRTRELLG